MESFSRTAAGGELAERAPAGDGPLLSVRGLTINIAGKELLAGVAFSLGAGEIAGICGPSGCGKTTLLRAVAGLIQPSTGEVWLKGKRPRDIGWPRYRRSVTLVSQVPVLIGQSVRESLERPFSFRAVAERFNLERAIELLELLGLREDCLAQAPSSLSVGQQQRVSLVRALLVTPQVALLDEPTSSLDEESRCAVENLVRQEARERGMGAVIVTHDREQTRRWCGRVMDLFPRSPAADPGSGRGGAGE